MTGSVCVGYITSKRPKSRLFSRNLVAQIRNINTLLHVKRLKSQPLHLRVRSYLCLEGSRLSTLSAVYLDIWDVRAMNPVSPSNTVTVYLCADLLKAKRVGSRAECSTDTKLQHNVTFVHMLGFQLFTDITKDFRVGTHVKSLMSLFKHSPMKTSLGALTDSHLAVIKKTENVQNESGRSCTGGPSRGNVTCCS